MATTPLASAVLLTACLAAVAAPVRAQVLTFEGLRNGEGVAEFYGGGAGSLGSAAGTDYGVSFSSNALALVRANAGGTGNFGGEPTSRTVLFFLSGAAATLNSASGFSTGFSFYYAAAFQPGVIRVFDGLNGTGTLLATLELPVTGNGAIAGCADNPGANFCTFVPIGVNFAGVARSIDFGGTVNQIAFDNVTLGASVPETTVPEPGTGALLGAGVVALAGLARRRRAR